MHFRAPKLWTNYTLRISVTSVGNVHILHHAFTGLMDIISEFQSKLCGSTAMNCVGCVDGESACSSLARRGFKEGCGIRGFPAVPVFNRDFFRATCLVGSSWLARLWGHVLGVGGQENPCSLPTLSTNPQASELPEQDSEKVRVLYDHCCSHGSQAKSRSRQCGHTTLEQFILF